MIIVTGGTQGIGLATAKTLALAKHKVLFAGRDRKAGEDAAREIEGATYMQADVSEEADCRALVNRALGLGDGKIRGLVNNAGVGARHNFPDTTVEQWDQIMGVNVRSVFMMTRFAIDGLIAAKGSVVNVASIAGLVGEENLAIYTASKSAVIGLTQALTLELGHLVRFNAVCPGQVATRMMDKVLGDNVKRRMLELRIPSGRLATPEDVSALIAWLISNQATYVNGAIIPVDGGETAGLRTPRQLN